MWGESLGKPAIYFRLTDPSALLFSKFTRENINKLAEFWVDGHVIMKVVIRATFDSGKGLLTGQLDLNEAEELVERLASGKAKLEVEPVAK